MARESIFDCFGCAPCLLVCVFEHTHPAFCISSPRAAPQRCINELTVDPGDRRSRWPRGVCLERARAVTSCAVQRPIVVAMASPAEDVATPGSSVLSDVASSAVATVYHFPSAAVLREKGGGSASGAGGGPGGGPGSSSSGSHVDSGRRSASTRSRSPRASVTFSVDRAAASGSSSHSRSGLGRLSPGPDDEGPATLLNASFSAAARPVATHGLLDGFDAAQLGSGAGASASSGAGAGSKSAGAKDRAGLSGVEGLAASAASNVVRFKVAVIGTGSVGAAAKTEARYPPPGKTACIATLCGEVPPPSYGATVGLQVRTCRWPVKTQTRPNGAAGRELSVEFAFYEVAKSEMPKHPHLHKALFKDADAVLAVSSLTDAKGFATLSELLAAAEDLHKQHSAGGADSSCGSVSPAVQMVLFSMVDQIALRQVPMHTARAWADGAGVPFTFFVASPDAEALEAHREGTRDVLNRLAEALLQRQRDSARNSMRAW